MNRFDYATRPRFDGGRALAFASRVRVPLVALLAALVFDGASWTVERIRVAVLEHESAVRAARLDSLADAVTHARAREHELQRLHETYAHIADLAASGNDAAGAVIAIGNALPPHVWLTAVRMEPNGASLEGRSASLQPVGTALSSLARLPRYGGARLVAVHGEAGRMLSYSITLEAAR